MVDVKEDKKNLSTKSKEKEPKPKKPIPTYDQIEDNVYDRIETYATRFIIISLVGVVIGVIGIVYGVLNVFFLGTTFQDIFVALGVFIGVGAIVASIVLLVWGLFWRRKVENKSIM
jgi:predicted signal transduction protein with EAL and GGDEF domain